MKFNLRNFIFGITIGIIAVSFIGFSGVADAGGHNYNQCNENNLKNCPEPSQVCDKGKHMGNPHCYPTVTPTATPTPTTTPSGGQGGGGGGQSNNAPAPAVCEIPFQAPILQGFSADGNGSVTFSWWPSPNVSKYSVTYGYTPDNLMFGEDNIPSSSTSIQLNGLIPGHNVWAQVQAWQGGCEESSNLFDPVVR